MESQNEEILDEVPLWFISRKAGSRVYIRFENTTFRVLSCKLREPVVLT